jgi:putative photosynthetic complex assembly protein
MTPLATTIDRPSPNKLPARPIQVLFALLAVTVVAIGVMRLAGYQPEASKPVTAPDATRTLAVLDGAKGSVIVRDAKTGQDIQMFKSAEGAFVRATFRALVNDRRHKSLPLQESHFRLERHNGHQLFLIDEATGRVISLNAFGPANTAVFAAFMSNQKGEGQ